MCVRCGEMAAEVERLTEINAKQKTVIDAANAQEPVGYICKVAGYLDFEEWISGDTKDEIRENFYKKKEAHAIVDNCIANPERWSEPVFVYAAPIPAQQSPAVAVPDTDVLASIIRKVDGAHSLGASALAERIVEELIREAKHETN